VKATLNGFEELRGAGGFPDVFGCVDGTHTALYVHHQRTQAATGTEKGIIQSCCRSSATPDTSFSTALLAGRDPQMMHGSAATAPLARPFRITQTWCPSTATYLETVLASLSTCLLTPYRDNGHLSAKRRCTTAS